MEKRRIGTSDLFASVLGFGGWAAGRRGWDGVKEQEIDAAIQQAFELGVNFFDTAPAYGLGESERVIGKVLKPVRDKIILATKFGWDWDEQENMWKDVTRNRILKEIDDSLLRLGTDYIDLYQLHWPDPTGQTPFEETFEAVNEIVKAGKVRYVGVCNLSVAQLDEVRNVTHIVSHQDLYNLLERDVEKEILPYTEEHQLGFIPYSPIAQGILTGKFTKETTFPSEHVRNTINPLFERKAFLESLEKVEKLKKIATKYEKPPGQVAINWLLSRPTVSTVIVGAENPDQVRENAGATSWELQRSDVELLDQIFNKVTVS